MSLVYLKLSSLPEGVAQMLVDLVDLAPDQPKLSFMSLVYLKLSSLPDGVAQMLVDLDDFAPDQYKLSKNRKYLLRGVREWWLNWLN